VTPVRAIQWGVSGVTMKRHGRRAVGKAKPTKRAAVPAAVDWDGVTLDRVEYAAGATIFSQGDPARAIFYVVQGSVRLSVVSSSGKEAVIAVLTDHTYFGEGCLVGQSHRMATASALTVCTVISVETQEMAKQLHSSPQFADGFMRHMVTRNIRIEEDLIDQLFNSSEKRLARTLLLLARYGGVTETSHRKVPRVSQETLAEMVGTTRSRVNFFMNKFRRLGFIEYNGTIKINNSLLSVLLHD
jgi:CRP/FNR family cyclic AMP-dependent transcriptional regulator